MFKIPPEHAWDLAGATLFYDVTTRRGYDLGPFLPLWRPGRRLQRSSSSNEMVWDVPVILGRGQLVMFARGLAEARFETAAGVRRQTQTYGENYQRLAFSLERPDERRPQFPVLRVRPLNGNEVTVIGPYIEMDTEAWPLTKAGQ